LLPWQEQVVASFAPNDVVVILSFNSSNVALSKRTSLLKGETVVVDISWGPPQNSLADVGVHLPSAGLLSGSTSFGLGADVRCCDASAELALKLCCNAITTVAHVMAFTWHRNFWWHRGAVYQNRMINVSVTNNKLLFRAIKIVEDIARVSTDAAKVSAWPESVLKGQKAIVQVVTGSTGDVSTVDDALADADAFVGIASTKRLVVPLSILVATGFTVERARWATSCPFSL
jgi:hypothetical protein